MLLETGMRGLKTWSDPEQRELTLARVKIGELMMRLELADASSRPDLSTFLDTERR